MRDDLGDGSSTLVPRGGLHLWVRLPDDCDDVEVAQRAGHADVLVEAGSPYFVTEAPAPHLRLTDAAATPDQLRAGVRRLAAVIDTVVRPEGGGHRGASEG